jgi:hypothetical protein
LKPKSDSTNPLPRQNFKRFATRAEADESVLSSKNIHRVPLNADYYHVIPDWRDFMIVHLPGHNKSYSVGPIPDHHEVYVHNRPDAASRRNKLARLLSQIRIDFLRQLV